MVGQIGQSYLVNALQGIDTPEGDTDFLKKMYGRLYEGQTVGNSPMYEGEGDAVDPRFRAVRDIGSMINDGTVNAYDGYLAQANINKQFGFKPVEDHMSDEQNARLAAAKLQGEIEGAKNLGISQEEYNKNFANQGAGLEWNSYSNIHNLSAEDVLSLDPSKRHLPSAVFSLDDLPENY
jgi:hypothetical protein